MDFRFSDDQLLLQTTLRDFLAKEHTPEVLRKLWQSESGRSRALWKQLAELGVPGLLVPEERGGMGLGEVEGVLIHEEAGRAALAEPLIPTMAVAAPLLSEAGGELASAWLPRIAAGDAVVAAGHRSPLLGWFSSPRSRRCFPRAWPPRSLRPTPSSGGKRSGRWRSGISATHFSGPRYSG